MAVLLCGCCDVAVMGTEAEILRIAVSETSEATDESDSDHARSLEAGAKTRKFIFRAQLFHRICTARSHDFHKLVRLAELARTREKFLATRPIEEEWPESN